MTHDEFDRVAGTVGLVIEGLGVLVIVVSVLHACALLAQRSLSAATRSGAYGDTRRCLGRGILLGLEFLVAGDIVRTVAVGPSLESVALLGLIVVIRTFLSFALEVELNGRWPWAKEQPAARAP